MTFLEYLLREGLIESYHFRDKVPNWSGCAAVLLSRKGGNYYVPVVIHLRQTKVLKGIKSVSTPGKYRYLNYRDLLIFTQKNAGAGAVVIMSSSYFGRLCTAKELLAVGQGGLVLCVVET